jgi:hypothetical protein
VAAQYIVASALRAMLAVCAMICIVAPARADLISDIVYHLTVCGDSGAQPGGECYVQPVQAVPPPGATQAVIDAALIQFFTDTGISDIESISSSITGANHIGFVYGIWSFSAPNDGGTFIGGYIFHNGSILCCNIDGSYLISGLNDNGIFIGHNADFIPFASSDFDAGGISQNLPSIDAASQALWNDMAFGGEGSQFDAIDNANRISGVGTLGAFILTPVDPTQVPEPGSLVLLASALALFMGCLKCIRSGLLTG